MVVYTPSIKISSLIALRYGIEWNLCKHNSCIKPFLKNLLCATSKKVVYIGLIF